MDLEMKPEDIAYVEKSLGYTFKDKKLLVRALTRKAFAQERKQQGESCEDQEIYRILGDAVLKTSLVELLIEKGFDSRETITKKKIDLEKRESLGLKLREMKIAPFIRFGAGEKKQEISKQSSVLGETLEALIAAVHIDGGSYKTTKEFVTKLFKDQVFKTSSQHVAIKASPNLEETADQLWMRYNVCNTCWQPEICAKVRICHFDLSDGD